MIQHSNLLAHPCVFVVEHHYQIMVGVKEPCLLWLEIDGKRYSDAAAGVMRSDTETHSVRVPQEVLDEAGKYTVCLRMQIDRKPYFPVFSPVIRLEYAFRPLPASGSIRIYHISDAHSAVAEPVAAGRHFGTYPDLLVLNGDVLNHAGSVRDMQTVLAVGGALCEGVVPIVCSRGNHDLRGILAERVNDYLPSSGGNFYYTFRVGRIWGVVLDCAEDKIDECDEYGGTVDCHAYREAQTEMLRRIVSHAEEEYVAPGVAYRLVISHMPFSFTLQPPFDIEQPLYRTWCSILCDSVHPDLMLCGHLHLLRVEMPNSPFDCLGQPCPVIIGGNPIGQGRYGGAAITLDGRLAEIVFNDNFGEILGRQVLQL